VQDAALRAWRRINNVTLSEKGDFEAYVRRAVQNRIRDEARAQRRHPVPDQLHLEVRDGQPSPFDEAVKAEAAQRYEAAFSRLTDEERELLLARFDYGFSHEQVAELLGKPSAAAARMATVRAVQRLKALIAAM
jgi:RNA polymerase sigma factor (sigma-70 family)